MPEKTILHEITSDDGRKRVVLTTVPVVGITPAGSPNKTYTDLQLRYFYDNHPLASNMYTGVAANADLTETLKVGMQKWIDGLLPAPELPGEENGPPLPWPPE